ncbi:magnesium transporter CorA family protein [Sporosarcina obsidiansis]|uniref:magnesium transporter CorA family protein n=1 Tax=Sporosarcina obsidiansis TaxID=2660748 RepID=UPI00129A36E9|nr:magnesium transporter CorA family protein [Sporosarcina obsidiansis]
MEQTTSGNDWKWIDIGKEQNLRQKLVKEHQMCESWMDALDQNDWNAIGISTAMEGEEAIWGNLTYIQSMEEKENSNVFSFFLTTNLLLTHRLDLSTFSKEAQEELTMNMKRAENALEGFTVLLNTILYSFLQQIDQFEYRLRELIWEIKENNNLQLLDRISQSRHELIIWNNLVIPVIELQLAIEETFNENLLEIFSFRQLCKRLKRIRLLITEYMKEVEALTDLESLVSSQRGNEIMKTLTVITTVFMPSTVFGAIWGMNFKFMPELDEKYAYVFALSTILLTTGLIYLYMHKKGWTGEILHTRSKNSLFK